jgi:hypothetical protein
VSIHIFCIRYSSVLDDSSSSPAISYLATTSTTATVDPTFLMKAYRSNSQNRILSPTFSASTNSSRDLGSGYTSLRRPRGDRLTRNYSLDNDNSSSSLRLDNYVTLRRRRSDYTPSVNHSPTPSPMVLSPSATRQFSYCPSSREGSVTPRYSHSCSNASIVSESAAD